MLNHICHRTNFKPVGTGNKGDIYTLILFLAQLLFLFSPFKKKERKSKRNKQFPFSS
jgi:hypothetical protein